MLLIPVYSLSQRLEKEIAGTEKVSINDIYGDLVISGNSTQQIKIAVTGQNTVPETTSSYQPEYYKIDKKRLYKFTGLFIYRLNIYLPAVLEGKIVVIIHFSTPVLLTNAIFLLSGDQLGTLILPCPP